MLDLGEIEAIADTGLLMRPNEHDFHVTINLPDIDFMGHVNNAVYLKWVQAAVFDHWETFADPDDVVKHLWVALNHTIYYRKPAFANDQVFVSVALNRLHGTRAFYKSFVRRGAVILAEVNSVWCCVDSTSLRPVRIGKSIFERFL